MTEAGVLDKALGVELPRPLKALLMARNFNRNRAVWRKHFYFDPLYRRSLTRAAGKLPVPTRFALQIGHMFSLPEVFPDKRCISYHDGNLAESLKSGYGLTGVSSRRIDQAMRFEEQAAHSMTAIFTFSEYLRSSFINDYRVPPERVFVAGSGMNLSTFPDANPAKSYTSGQILFIGVEFVRKGGPQLLEAFRAVRDAIPSAQLHIVGPHRLENIPPGVEFHGHLSKADPGQAAKLESLFRQSTLFVLPSLYEPFGIAPLEAMLYQLPCIVTDAWALRETVLAGVTGELVEKGSADDLATKMIALLAHPDRLAKYGNRGRERALNYTWNTVAQRMAGIVDKLPA
jgi:glycosyltransferase involved in cell wall biosynthesis